MIRMSPHRSLAEEERGHGEATSYNHFRQKLHEWSRISSVMKITTLLSTILATATTVSLHAATFDPNVDAEILVNGHKADSTGYYGYLVETPGIPLVQFDGKGRAIYAFSGLFLDYQGQPLGASAYEGNVAAGLVAVASARRRVGSPPVMENYQLDQAAMAINREMFRQDWQGANFPNGKTLSDFLRQAGWAGDPANVVAITRAKPKLEGLLANDFFAIGKVIQDFRPVIDPSFQTMGYSRTSAFADQPDGGRVSAIYYETVLLSRDPVPTSTQAMYSYHGANDLFGRRGASVNTPTVIIGHRGKRLVPSGIVVSSQQLVGRAKLKGRLPRGVHFNGTTGKFSGVPRKLGRFHPTVTATYRMVAGEGATGRHTTNVLIRIVR